ncbi:MAG: hypothetical protein J2P15_20170 [Micromonosporaceae bacterium]|nr:hypothetical protein [Micromonosporaceae bacterium]
MPFLFGIADRGTGDSAGLPGPVLVRLLGDLGLSVPAARALIARMTANGQLAATRRGRAADYRLAGPFAESYHRIRTGATGAPWAGYFHAVLYQVPERNRAFRDLLRRTGIFAGYGLLQQGVLISPTDRSDRLEPVLAQTPRAAQVHFGELHMDHPAAIRAAYAAWDLGALDRTYRAHARRLRAALARRSGPLPPDGRTLRRLCDLLTTPLVDLLRSTGLPAELAPEDWSRPDLLKAIEQLQATYAPPAAAYVQRLLTT